MIRADLAAIARWIPVGAKVLDLGCGDGTLLRYLRDERRVTGYGIEIEQANIIASLANGVNVIQMDLEAGLSGFDGGSFDQVILSQTLQAVRHTEAILREMLRVGRCGIVTFPNFGHWQNRWQILQGKMPVSPDLPYQWFDTPNIHLCTLRDFEALCGSVGARVTGRVVISAGKVVQRWPNLLGSIALYRFEAA